jgi:muramidase (phage lysozyme)
VTRLSKIAAATWQRMTLIGVTGVTLSQVLLPAQAQPTIVWQSDDAYTEGNSDSWSRQPVRPRNPVNRLIPQFRTPCERAPEPAFEPGTGELEPLTVPQTPLPGSPSQFSGSSNLLAFLRMIRYAEGTASSDGYRIMFTSRRFSSFYDHPRQMNCSAFRGRRLCSTAAGAYQFLDTTWDSIARRIGATDFGPGWQDRAATELVRGSGALADIEAGNIERAISRTAGIWASFPRWSGDMNGRYNQAVKPMSELVRAYHQYRQQALVSQRTPQE